MRMVALRRVMTRSFTVTEVFCTCMGSAHSGVRNAMRWKPMMPFGVHSESRTFSAVIPMPALSIPQAGVAHAAEQCVHFQCKPYLRIGRVVLSGLQLEAGG